MLEAAHAVGTHGSDAFPFPLQGLWPVMEHADQRSAEQSVLLNEDVREDNPENCVPPEASVAVPAEKTAEDLASLACTARGIRWQLGILCGLGILFALYFAQAVFIPLMLSLVISMLLRPTVRWLSRRHVPESLGAAVCLASVIVVMAAGILPLLEPARKWLDHFPEHMERASEKLEIVKDRLVQLGKVRSQIAELAIASDKSEQPVAVRVKEPDLTGSAVVLSATGNMVGMWLVVIVLSFFLLTSGDVLINNVLMILPTIREKRRTVELIKEIERGISSYLLTITMINFGLGCVTGIVLWLLGVPNPAVWGLMATVFNYIPFVGPGMAGLAIGIVALLSFDSFGYALLAPLLFYVIAAVEGNVVTPLLLGRNMSLNPVLVLAFLVCWGWMWGIAGAALAVPILAMLKIGCDHFESTRPVGTLLGG